MAVRKINTEIALGGEKQFNDQMKAVNSNLKALKSEMALVTEEFADNANSTEALEAKHSILTQQAEQQKEVVRNLNEMVKKSVEVNGEDAAATDKWRMQLNNATADLIKKERELAANEKAQKDLVEAQEAAAKAAEEEAKAQEEAADASEDAAKEAKKEASEYSKLTGKYKDITEAVDKFTKKYEVEINLLKAAGSAIGGTVKGIGKLAAAGTVATGAVAALAIEGISTLTKYAKEAAESGDPAFAGLANNLNALDGASKSAKAALGAVLLPALTSLSGEGTALLNDFSAAMAATNGDTEQMGEVISEYLGKAVELIRANLPKIMKLGGELIEGLGAGLIENAPQILSDAEYIIGSLLDGIAAHAADIGQGAVQLIKMFSDTLIRSGPDLINAGGEIVISLISALPELIQTLIDGFLSADNLTAIKDIGVGIVKAIWNGISDMLGWLWDKVSGIFKGKTIDAPSVGMPSGTGGYAGGLDYVPYDNFPAYLHKGEQVLTAREASAYRSSGGGNTVNIAFYAQQITEADVDMIVDTANRRLGGSI